ncbi:MAG: hypothetical protein HYY06_09660 [Deltaproteobacteria bacterium]|nr:hypothetical protein [Deltaproteobacteria bacterium]
MSLRFVVVGTGRSGTKYASELFTRLGIRCGHEALFSAAAGADLVGDASFGIVPSLSGFRGLVFHQTRHPLAVLSSIASTGFFVSPGPYEPYLDLITRTVPGIGERTDPIRKAMHYVVRWNLMAEPFARLRWRVEDLDAAVLAEATRMIGMPRTEEDCTAALREVPPDTNSLERGGVARLNLEWSDLEECPEKLELASLARRYGYDP